MATLWNLCIFVLNCKISDEQIHWCVTFIVNYARLVGLVLIIIIQICVRTRFTEYSRVIIEDFCTLCDLGQRWPSVDTIHAALARTHPGS